MLAALFFGPVRQAGGHFSIHLSKTQQQPQNRLSLVQRKLLCSGDIASSSKLKQMRTLQCCGWNKWYNVMSSGRHAKHCLLLGLENVRVPRKSVLVWLL